MTLAKTIHGEPFGEVSVTERARQSKIRRTTTTVSDSGASGSRTIVPQEFEVRPSEFEATGGLWRLSSHGAWISKAAEHVSALGFLEVNLEADRELDRLAKERLSEFEEELL